jgi:hypothetical protein
MDLVRHCLNSLGKERMTWGRGEKAVTKTRFSFYNTTRLMIDSTGEGFRGEFTSDCVQPQNNYSTCNATQHDTYSIIGDHKVDIWLDGNIKI